MSISRNPRTLVASLLLPKATMSQKSEPKTKGTEMSDKNRKKANTLSAEERHELMGKALELIYAGGKGKICAPRR